MPQIKCVNIKCYNIIAYLCFMKHIKRYTFDFGSLEVKKALHKLAIDNDITLGELIQEALKECYSSVIQEALKLEDSKLKKEENKK
jgi:hypothetical protein